MQVNIKQTMFFIILILFARVNLLRVKTQMKSGGCSISLKKMQRNKVESVSFISEIQDSLFDFDTRKIILK
jgi:hypothetical protein